MFSFHEVLAAKPLDRPIELNVGADIESQSGVGIQVTFQDTDKKSPNAVLYTLTLERRPNVYWFIDKVSRVNLRHDFVQDATRRIVHSASLVIVILLALPALSFGDDQQPEKRSVSEVANRIDELIAKRWSTENVIAADQSSDAEFLRRTYLDIAGRIPPTSGVRKFLNDTSGNKREQLIKTLLDSPTYNTHFTTVWRNALIPEATTGLEFRQLVPGFEAWLWQQMHDNRPYDAFVAEILTTPVAGNLSRAPGQNTKPTPFAFYQAKQLKPENMAAATSRIFLGVRLECAQCHDHPFDQWKQEQFWNYAAFFAGLSASDPRGMSAVENRQQAEITIPDTETTVPAMYLTGDKPKFTKALSTRETLSKWLIAKDNPFFAKMAVNRMWAHFFGIGIVEPVDDFSAENPPSHPELLDELASEFAAHDFDLKFIIRAITNSKTYQLSSRQTDASQSEERLFARMAVKGLTPEQMFDSLAEAIGFYQPYRTDNPFVLDDNSPRAEFLRLFRDESVSPTERETTILQALAMMNGEFVADATSLEDSQTLSAALNFPLMTPAQRLETLFLAALGRKPTATEVSRLTELIDTAGKTNTADSKHAVYTDVFWAMLNSSEFLFNH